MTFETAVTFWVHGPAVDAACHPTHDPYQPNVSPMNKAAYNHDLGKDTLDQPCAAVPRPKSETVFRSDFQDRASEVDSRISVAFAFGATPPLSRSDHRLQAFPCALRRRDSCRNASGTYLSISTSYSRAIYPPPSPNIVARVRTWRRAPRVHLLAPENIFSALCQLRSFLP